MPRSKPEGRSSKPETSGFQICGVGVAFSGKDDTNADAPPALPEALTTSDWFIVSALRYSAFGLRVLLPSQPKLIPDLDWLVSSKVDLQKFFTLNCTTLFVG